MKFSKIVNDTRFRRLLIPASVLLLALIATFVFAPRQTEELNLDSSEAIAAPDPRLLDVIAGDAGWTSLKPSKNSHLIYVDSKNGNDISAAQVKKRGYYLPDDPEIGPDPTNPVGPIVAYATHFEAAKKVRLSKAKGEDANGFPIYASNQLISGYSDWLLLRRGGDYTNNPSLLSTNAQSSEDFDIGMLLGGPYSTALGWDEAKGALGNDCGPWRGRSASQPAVITAWGPDSEPRPRVRGFTIGGGSQYICVVSLDLGATAFRWGQSDGDMIGGPVLIEDCAARSLGPNNISRFPKGITIRRCVISGSANPRGGQGMFVAGPHVMTFEECVFDRNGYIEDPEAPQTWTGALISIQEPGAMPIGTGVQPTRRWLDRNLYLSSYKEMTIRGCIISRDGGGGSVQMRQGGVCERNLFIWNEQALGVSHPEAKTEEIKSSLVRQNVVLHDDCFLPPGRWGIGFASGGADDDTAVIDDNIIAHFHRESGGGVSIYVGGKHQNRQADDQVEAFVSRAVVKGNVIYQRFGTPGLFLQKQKSSEVLPGTVITNGIMQASVISNHVSTKRLLAGQGDGKKPATFTYTDNQYHSTGDPSQQFALMWNGHPYWLEPKTGTFKAWKDAGYDGDVRSVEKDFPKFKITAGWIQPERDIVSYMKWVDPAYVVNEDVYVDEDCTGPKQIKRQKVWEVLMQDVPGGKLPIEQAKLAARRYHAFVTFIQRAKANRKGAWDKRYTAEAVNNYIRLGFGKNPVTGPYTASIMDVNNY